VTFITVFVLSQYFDMFLVINELFSSVFSA